MVKPLVVQASCDVQVPADRAFEVVLPMPLERIFDRRFAAIPPIRGTEEEVGIWGTVGQTRTIQLADGATMHERLTRVDPPEAFGYTITGVTGMMKPLSAHIEGLFTFIPVGEGARVTWQWTVHPRSAVSALAMPVFAWMWRGYARLAMERIESLVLAG